MHRDPAPAPVRSGIGLRQPHLAALLDSRPALAFVEVHSENYFADGGAALAALHAARAAYPVSLHGVGLSLGAAAGLDTWHLERLAQLVERIEPVRVSDHASFARAPRHHGAAPVHAGDLLPIAFTDASLHILAANVQRVQDRLRRPILVEHLSAYLHWADDRIAEPQFFDLLARRSGCQLLLDVNNLVVNALNAVHAAQVDGGARGTGAEAAAVAQACAWIDAIDPRHVGEIHLAGYTDTGDIVIDDHGSRVHAPVWQVYRHAIGRLGPRPTLVEWDTDLPALPVLLDEAALAESVLAAAALQPEPA
ncbi:DUF692 domain-containing protein [Rubrivivax sp. RP6-9]|uniref:DUF692 domain-containing protein n=1 Tax=Rubrivivax sp. RP6-9 TaxID=3415750 RepID=UPI003CC64C18